MKLGSRNVEWIMIAALAIVIITQFLLFVGGVNANTVQTTMINVLLLMSIATQLIIGIILLRIYDVLVAKKK